MEKNKLTNYVRDFERFEKIIEADTLTPESVDEIFEQFRDFVSDMKGIDFSTEDAEMMKNIIKQNRNVDLSSKAVHISNDKVVPWVKDKKSSISWDYWEAYEEYLRCENIPRKSIIETSQEIDDILDLSGDPKNDFDSWQKRGLVMGNVQSGKTLNFTGLINKAVDVGYKYIILIGSINDNNLRMQTQSRVDMGFTGFDTSVLPRQPEIGVGKIRKKRTVLPFTTRALNGDFRKSFANTQSVNSTHIKEEIPLIFVVKKNTSVLNNIYEWFRDHHKLEPENGGKMSDPLLFIDDEADWASPNTKSDDSNPTKINQKIRLILSLFNKSTYIAYTATPFANIFIDHMTTDEVFGDDLFPKDFMTKLHLSDAYKGQDFYFPRDINEDNPRAFDPIIEIPFEEVDFYRPKTRKVDKFDPNRFRIEVLTESLKEAMRCFIINNCVRALRGDDTDHNTMLVNVTHRVLLMNDLADCVSEYLADIQNGIRLAVGLPHKQRMKNSYMQDLYDTYHKHYNHLESESFDKILEKLNECAQKIEVRAINSAQSGMSLDYDRYEKGLSVIAVGGNKLSRGLTLEGLSVSYFDRTSTGSDTLTQMCRWFGYRPNYSDICKVYLSESYRSHYTYISLIIDELYQEFSLMKAQGRTPRDFGIKVREHPENITITAKNKMRKAASTTVQVGLWGRETRHSMFRNNDEVNNNNFIAADEFLTTLISKNNYRESDVNKDIVFHDVEYELILEFLTAMDIIPYSQIPIEKIIEFIDHMKNNKCSPFKVLLPIRSKHTSPAWLNEEKPCDKIDIFRENMNTTLGGKSMMTYWRTIREVGNFLQYSKQEIGTGRDEKSLFTKDEIDTIAQQVNLSNDKLSNFHFRHNSYRDFPTLVMWPFNLFTLPENNNVIIPFSKPTIGFRLSFPTRDNVSAKQKTKLRENIDISYALNTVAQQQEIIFDTDTINESEDDE